MKTKNFLKLSRINFWGAAVLLTAIYYLLPTISLAQNTRLWATYYGGSGNDNAYGVATDASGNVYMAGQTDGASGIASGGFQNTFGGAADAFLVKFDAAGNRLWATYYGGTGSDGGYAVTTDASGNVYLGGYTSSTSGIASGGFQNSFGTGDADALDRKSVV